MGTQWRSDPDPRFAICSGACGGDRDCTGCSYPSVREEVDLLGVLLLLVALTLAAVAYGAGGWPW